MFRFRFRRPRHLYLNPRAHHWIGPKSAQTVTIEPQKGHLQALEARVAHGDVLGAVDVEGRSVVQAPVAAARHAPPLHVGVGSVTPSDPGDGDVLDRLD